MKEIYVCIHHKLIFPNNIVPKRCDGCMYVQSYMENQVPENCKGYLRIYPRKITNRLLLT